ncbi:hypothetical protein [Nostoc sp. LPT]|uniref:hypothetical protein n=1 Tax=Nostoc sp. LPT TaxID=2815387 RepID=UPI001D1FBCAC|nr:hypothetical protein [Nostoc sp. LPT]MBN4001355.1 glycine zipper family protein [Nostoc sp. LPT]
MEEGNLKFDSKQNNFTWSFQMAKITISNLTPSLDEESLIIELSSEQKAFIAGGGVFGALIGAVVGGIVGYFLEDVTVAEGATIGAGVGALAPF